MKSAKLTTLHAAAKTRAPGYLEACLKAGKISPDALRVEFTDEAHARLRQQYNPISRIPSHSSHLRLGDRLHTVLGPIGRLVRWPCLKGDGTTDLKPGTPCARARGALNNIKPFSLMTRWRAGSAHLDE